MPNRYSSYLQSAPKIENLIKLKINRFDIGLHNSGMFDQSRSFFNFARYVLKYTKDKNYDLFMHHLMTHVCIFSCANF